MKARMPRRRCRPVNAVDVHLSGYSMHDRKQVDTILAVRSALNASP